MALYIVYAVLYSATVLSNFVLSFYWLFQCMHIHYLGVWPLMLFTSNDLKITSYYENTAQLIDVPTTRGVCVGGGGEEVLL